MLAMIIFPMSALLALLGLCAIAPRDDRHMYSAPAAQTVAVLVLLAIVTARWSWA